MALPLAETLAMVVPPAWYYGRRIGYETRTGEPELAALAKLIGRRGTAIDIGTNQGFYAYALAAVANRVLAFEPHPDYARFARRMLRGRAEVYAMALSDKPGRGSFHVPLADDGMVLHLAGSLKRTHTQFRRELTYEVEVRTLDGVGPELGVTDLAFIKADVEGSEREVLDGARTMIARDRPVILLELLSGTHQDPGGYAAAICDSFGYDAFIYQHGDLIAALPAIAALGKNTSWGTAIDTRNVLFRPQ
jgi:FkbM family methyltransferase